MYSIYDGDDLENFKNWQGTLWFLKLRKTWEARLYYHMKKIFEFVTVKKQNKVKTKSKPK